MHGHQRVVHGVTHRQQLLAAADDLRISPLGQVHLVLNELHHGLSRRQIPHRRQPVLPNHLRNVSPISAW